MHDFSKVDETLTMSEAKNLLNTHHNQGHYLSEYREAIENAARRGDLTIELEGVKFKLTYHDRQVRINPIIGYTPCGWVSF